MKRLLILLLIVVSFNSNVSYGINAPDPADFYEDVSRETVGRYYNGVNWVLGTRVAKGFDDETFRPGQCVTRAELLKMLVLSEKKDIEYQNDIKLFSDVDFGDWFYDYVRYGFEEGVVEGYEDETFRPNQCVNRAEGLKIIVEGKVDEEFIEDYSSNIFFYGLETSDDFKDSWWRKYVRTLLKENISIDMDYQVLDGVITVGLNPGKDLTRAEVAHLLYELRDSDLTYTNLTRYTLGDIDLMLPNSLSRMNVEYSNLNNEEDWFKFADVKIEMVDPYNEDRWISFSSIGGDNRLKMYQNIDTPDFYNSCSIEPEEFYYSYGPDVTDEDLRFSEVGFIPRTVSCTE